MGVWFAGFVILMITITVAIEIMRCVNPRFRKFLQSEGWDADV